MNRYGVEGVGLTTISSFGIVGNIMSIIVLTRRHSAFVRCVGRSAQSEGLTAGRSLCVPEILTYYSFFFLKPAILGCTG